MKDIFGQIFAIWKDFKPFQKLTVISMLLLVGGGLSFFVIGSPSARYVALYSTGQLQEVDRGEVRSYLERGGIPFKEKKGKGFLVPEEFIHKIRTILVEAGIPKQDKTKGFELFDSNTWIKGEKELQVLEMRALKGQLEKDIAEYDNIKNASVILDLAPPRLFGGSQYKTKASVILTLMPGTHLSTSELRAIGYHLSGAVRGLDPNMIAISDTTGKLYLEMNPDGDGELKVNSALVIEENLLAKVDNMLIKIVGRDHFHNTVNVIVDRESDEVEAISIGILVDRILLADQSITAPETLRKEIERQVKVLAEGYGVEAVAALDFVPFEKKKSFWTEKKRVRGYSGMIYTSLTILLALVLLYFFFQRKKKKQSNDEDQELLRIMTTVDIDKLAESIQEEDPETIALMLSYLQTKRAETIILALPEEVQKKVLWQLAEMEKEDVS